MKRSQRISKAKLSQRVRESEKSKRATKWKDPDRARCFWPDFLSLENELRSPPLSIVFITVIGLILAVMMTWEGFFIRIFNEFQAPTALWIEGVLKLGLDPGGFAWPWIVLGISWIGALAGIWLGLSWGRGAVTVCGIFSLFYVGVGTILALIALLCISLPVSKLWMSEGNASATD
jgi:hypothetical protein